ncbi:hypothetical protein SAMN06295967_11493 [Belliella buryatensis]|uniref:Uncharacterized protein n=1 Tax=Belliella buryatensis TaxID=1500549 RepID=A0A239G486_9BACT|nr:hypothetical protein SAMN06295967_11493 [Belliella buryatensis]
MKKNNFLVLGNIIMSTTFLTTLKWQTVGKCFSGSSEEGQYVAC